MVEKSTIQTMRFVWDRARADTQGKKSVAVFQVVLMFFGIARWSSPSDIENVLSPSWPLRISEVLLLTLPRLSMAVPWLLTAFPPWRIMLAQMCLPSGQGVRFIYSFRFMPVEWMQGLDYGFAYTRKVGCEFTSYSVNLHHAGCSLQLSHAVEEATSYKGTLSVHSQCP